MNEDNGPPKVGASLGTTINIGNFENYKIDVWLSQVPVDATEAQIAERLKQGKQVLEQIIFGLAEELGERIMDVKRSHNLK